MVTNVRDPRSIITPDAFELDPTLLGLPLAEPSKRLWAILVDLLVVGVLTAITGSIALFVWGGVALFFISMAFRSPGERLGPVTSWLFRGATGCLGFMILSGVLIGFLVVRDGGDDDEGSDVEIDLPTVPGLPGGLPQVDASGGVAVEPTLRDVFRGLSEAGALRQADDTTEARAALEALLSTMGRAGLQRDELAEAARGFRELVPPEAPWRSDIEVVEQRALDAVVALGVAEEDETEAAEGDGELEPGLVVEIAAMSDPEVLTAYAEVVGDTAAATGDRARLLRARALPLIAADTLAGLERTVAALAEQREELIDDLEDAREELAEREGGFGALLGDIWDQLGSAIGLWSVYFTVALTLTRGRTVGKKIFGLRVLRLDGQPITWWFAFERAGGYVAGIATGLLGFAQVFWDPNRQCVHDKIGGTVVVVEGAQPIPGAWQEAWRQQQEEREQGRAT